ncbi:mitotic checkpoint protein-domain-containing protein [Lentinula aff. lateritia]|uniref:Mitotic checkpoint protein-domain-containing protein n=1 Tax=Lentinula aff. lateritia TaxID=2804960 RepID=A0ACC1TSC0_9AGAR|nr:mitotic checkpoint protein-domain-containing protein [Lentinula aff. lateritia]
MSTTSNSSSLFTSSSSSSTSKSRSNNLSASKSGSNSSILTRGGLKRDRDTFSSELELDSSLPNTKRHLRTAINNNLNASAVERKLAILQTNCAELEKKVREKDQRLDLLEKDRRWLNDQETEEREAREREAKEAREREFKLKHELSAAKISFSNLEVSHAELQDAHSKLERSRQHEVSLLKTQLEETQKQAMFFEARVEEEKNAAKIAASNIASASSSTSSLPQFTSSFPDTDNRLLTAELNRQATYLRQLEFTNTRLNADVVVLKSDNAFLRDRNSTVEVLKEEKRGLESRLKMKEVEVEKLVREVVRRDHRSSSSKRSSLPLSPSTLATHLGLDQDDVDASVRVNDSLQDLAHPTVKEISELASLRLEHAALLDQHGTTLSELAALRGEKEALLQETSPRGNLSVPEVHSQNIITSNLRIQLRLRDEELETALKELAFLEAAVARLTSDSNSSSHNDANTAAEVKHYQALYNDAKRLNAGLRSEIETSLDKLRQHSEQDIETGKKNEERVQLLQDQLVKMRTELQSEKVKREELEKSLDTVEQELFDLRGEVAGGRHIPPNTRVLEMKDNPHAEWEMSHTAVLERLKGENQALLKRLIEIEGALKEAGAAQASEPKSDASISTLVPRESLDIVVKDKEDLENVLKQKEKRLLRLQQVFKAKSAEFREAIESIMGVKLAFYPNGQVRVTSLFDLNASFVFGPDKTAKASSQMEPSGMNMQLVATGEGGPQDLPDMMRYWIETEACIPGFLASITLECYESSKRLRAT